MNYIIVRTPSVEEITLTYQSFLKDVMGYPEKEAFVYLEDLLLFIEDHITQNIFDSDVIAENVYKKVLELSNNIKIMGVFSKIEVIYKVDLSLSKIELISYKLSK